MATTTTIDIKKKHINLWINYCKTTIADISDVNEDSDLYVFITHLFKKMFVYYNKQKEKYDFIYNFLIKGTNFGKNIKDDLYMFFKKVVTHLDKEEQIKKLFRTFRLKIQREAFMTKLQKSIEELNDNLQAIVYVRTVTTESNDKKYAKEINRIIIENEKEKRVLKSECEKMNNQHKKVLETNKLLVKMLADKDKMVSDKDNLIAEMKEDKKNYEKRINKLENEKEKIEQKLNEMEDKMEKLRDDRDWWMRMCQNTVKK